MEGAAAGALELLLGEDEELVPDEPVDSLPLPLPLEDELLEPLLDPPDEDEELEPELLDDEPLPEPEEDDPLPELLDEEDFELELEPELLVLELEH